MKTTRKNALQKAPGKSPSNDSDIVPWHVLDKTLADKTKGFDDSQFLELADLYERWVHQLRASVAFKNGDVPSALKSAVLEPRLQFQAASFDRNQMAELGSIYKRWWKQLEFVVAMSAKATEEN